MTSNYWEELNIANVNSSLSEIHKHLLDELGLPDWLKDIKCPFCNKVQPLSSIREFGIKLNPKNLCDLFIQVACFDCKKMETLYFRRQVLDIADFIEFVSNKESRLTREPITEQKMSKEGYNNMLEMALEKMKLAPSL